MGDDGVAVGNELEDSGERAVEGRCGGDWGSVTCTAGKLRTLVESSASAVVGIDPPLLDSKRVGDGRVFSSSSVAILTAWSIKPPWPGLITSSISL